MQNNILNPEYVTYPSKQNTKNSDIYVECVDSQPHQIDLSPFIVQIEAQKLSLEKQQQSMIQSLIEKVKEQDKTIKKLEQDLKIYTQTRFQERLNNWLQETRNFGSRNRESFSRDQQQAQSMTTLQIVTDGSQQQLIIPSTTVATTFNTERTGDINEKRLLSLHSKRQSMLITTRTQEHLNFNNSLNNSQSFNPSPNRKSNRQSHHSLLNGGVPATENILIMQLKEQLQQARNAIQKDQENKIKLVTRMKQMKKQIDELLLKQTYKQINDCETQTDKKCDNEITLELQTNQELEEARLLNKVNFWKEKTETLLKEKSDLKLQIVSLTERIRGKSEEIQDFSELLRQKDEYIESIKHNDIIGKSIIEFRSLEKSPSILEYIDRETENLRITEETTPRHRQSQKSNLTVSSDYQNTKTSDGTIRQNQIAPVLDKNRQKSRENQQIRGGNRITTVSQNLQSVIKQNQHTLTKSKTNTRNMNQRIESNNSERNRQKKVEQTSANSLGQRKQFLNQSISKFELSKSVIGTIKNLENQQSHTNTTNKKVSQYCKPPISQQSLPKFCSTIENSSDKFNENFTNQQKTSQPLKRDNSNEVLRLKSKNSSNQTKSNSKVRKSLYHTSGATSAATNKQQILMTQKIQMKRQSEIASSSKQTTKTNFTCQKRKTEKLNIVQIDLNEPQNSLNMNADPLRSEMANSQSFIVNLESPMQPTQQKAIDHTQRILQIFKENNMITNPFKNQQYPTGNIHSQKDLFVAKPVFNVHTIPRKPKQFQAVSPKPFQTERLLDNGDSYGAKDINNSVFVASVPKNIAKVDKMPQFSMNHTITSLFQKHEQPKMDQDDIAVDENDYNTPMKL